MAPSGEPPFQRLPDELLRNVLDFIEPDLPHSVPPDRRHYLSVESLDPPPPPHDSTKEVGSFRCVCKRFADVGAPLLFSHVAVRFSKAGLERIETLADWPHLARLVQRFTYLMPFFYSVHVRQVNVAVPGAGGTPVIFDVGHLQQKMDEQVQIVESREDVRVLNKAIASFTSLQLVQLFRLVDSETGKLWEYIKHQHHEDSWPFKLNWPRACSHGSRTIGKALLASNMHSLRFSSPIMSPQSVEFLTASRPDSLYNLASRLTCLTLSFDGGTDDQKISELSPLFRTVFSTAQSMQHVHVGFPPDRPLNLPLEAVFHNVVWDKLVAFGIQGWRLEADEIEKMALRHRDRLKGLRLRDVFIKEGGLWKDVLLVLRERMHRLDWVSLRRIGYDVSEPWLAADREILDDAQVWDSETESDEDDDDEAVASSSSDNGVDSEQDDDEDDDIDDDSSDAADSESENGAAANTMEFPDLNSPNTIVAVPWCSCNTHVAEDLEDDGVFVSNPRRKEWEKWVLRRCLVHSERRR